MKLSTYVNFGEFEEADIDVIFNVTPGSLGRYTGPWEDCYPAEPPEVEIETILFQGQDVTPLISDDQFERIEVECFEYADKCWESDY